MRQDSKAFSQIFVQTRPVLREGHPHALVLASRGKLKSASDGKRIILDVPQNYSVRSAFMGSIAAARAAGMIAATNAQAAREPIAMDNATGSQLATP